MSLPERLDGAAAQQPQLDMIRVLVVDDHPVVCQGIRRLLEQEADLSVCAEAGDTKSALQAIESYRPDVVLLDLKLKDSDGLTFLRKILERHPDLRVLVHSMYARRLYAEAALQAGARGYIVKQEAAGTVVDAIRRVMRGEIYVSEG